MTLHSPLRSQSGHVLRVPAPKPPHPGMSWAEMARREGHRVKEEFPGAKVVSITPKIKPPIDWDNGGDFIPF